MERHALRRFYGRQILKGALFASTALVMPLVAPRPALAQIAPNTTPQGGVVVGGSASIAQGAGSTTINQGSQRAAINWQSFDVGSNAKVQFNQPNASAIALNRVTGGNLSQINGQINANGQIVLINQSGVVFGKGSQVNAESVVVSTSDIAPGDFMAGRMNFSGAPKPGSQIINNGQITARDAGLVGLVAPQVANNGLITATLGRVVLAGASAFTLDLYGDRLISLDVTQAVRSVDVNGQLVPALVVNNGAILADGGKITLTAQDADALVTQLISAGGIVRADSVGAQTGTISLSGVGGNIQIAGNLLAQGVTPGSHGGDIQVLTDGTVAVVPGGNIDASGDAGGGLVAIGTDFSRAQTGPADTLAPAAAVVEIAQGSTIRANATGLGNAGTVTLLSQDFTGFQGVISGQGGTLGGNGGLTEISSRGVIDLGGTVLETAINGQPGEILLDPNNLYVTAGGHAGSVTGGGQVTFGNSSGTGGDSLVDPSQLDSLAGVVILEAAKLISVASAIDMTKASVLSLVSGGSISVTASIVVDGSLDLDAAGSLFIGAELNANNILLTSGNAGTDIESGVSTGIGGTLALASGGTIFEGAAGSIVASNLVSDGSIGGDVTLANGGNTITTLGSFTLGGNLTLANQGGLTVGGSVSAANITLSGASLTFESGVHTGILALSSSGTISQGAGTISAATLTGNAVSLASFTKPNAIGTLGAFSLSSGLLAVKDAGPLEIAGNVIVTGGTLALGGSAINQTGGRITAGTLTSIGTIGGDVSLASATNNIGTLGNFTLGGNLDLNDFTVLHIAGTVATPDSITLDATGGITEPGGIDAGTLSSGGVIDGSLVSVNLIGTNEIGTIGNFAVTNGSFGLKDGESLIIAGTVDVPASGFAYFGNGVTETSTGAIIATSFNTNAETVSGDILLTGSNTISEIDVPVAATGTFALNDTSGLSVDSKITAADVTIASPTLALAGSNLTIAATASTPSLVLATNDITTYDATDRFRAGNGTIQITPFSAGTTIDIGAVSSANTLGLPGSIISALDPTASTYIFGSGPVGTQASGIDIDGSVSFASAPVVDLSTSGTISDNSGSLTAGTLQFGAPGGFTQTSSAEIIATLFGGDGATAANVLLVGANTIASVGSLALSASSTLALFDTSTLQILGLISSPDEVLLSVASVGEVGAGAVEAGTLAGSASGSIALGGTNTIANLGSLLAGGDIYLADTGKLTVIDTVTASDVSIAVPTLSLGYDIFATNATSATLALATNQLTVTAGTFNVSTGGGTGTIFVAPYSANTGIDLAGSEANALDLPSSVIAAFDPAATEIVLGYAPVGTQATGISIDGNVSFAGSTLVDLSTSGAILDNAGTLTAATLAFDAAGFTQALGAALDLARLAGDGGVIGGSVTLPGTNNSIGNLADISLSGGALSLFDTAALTIDGLVTAPKLYLADSNAGGILFAGSLIAASGGTIKLSSDAMGTTATASTISAPSGTVVLAPFTATDAIDFGGTGFAGLTLTDALLELIGAGMLSVGTQGGGTIYTENSVSLTANELLFTGASIDLTGGTLALPGLLSFVSASDLSEADGVTLSVGGVAGTASGNVFLNSGDNTIGALGSISLGASGTLEVIDSGTLTIAGAIDPAEVILFGSLGLDIATNVSATLLEIGSNGTVIQSGGSITAGTLESDGSIGGDAYLTQAANAIGTLSAFTLGGLLDLIDTGLLDVTGPVGGANISLTAGTMHLDGLVDAGTLIALGSTGTISQTGGTLIATDLSSIGTIGGNALLDGAANTIATLTGFFTTGTLALDDTGAAGPLTLAGTVLAGHATLDAAGLDFEGYITIGGLLDLDSTAGASEASTGTITIGTLGSVGEITGGDVSLASAFNKIGTLGNVTLGGNLTLNDTVGLNIIGTVTTAGQILLTGAGLTETGGTLDAGTLTTGTGDETGNVLLTGGNDVVNLDAFTVTSGHTLALNDTGSLTIGGTVNAAVTTLSAASTIDIASDILASTELALGSGGTITQTAGTITTATLISDGSIGGDVTLGAPFAAGVDSIASLGDFTLGGSLLLGDSRSLDVTGVMRGTGLASEILLEDASTITIGGALIAPIVALSAANSIDLAGLIDAPTRLALGGGSITQTGGSIVAGSLTSGGTTITGDVALNRSGNTIAQIGIFDADGAFSLADTGSLAIIGPVTVGDFALAVPSLSLDADVNATAAGGTLALVSNYISVTAGTLGVDAGTIEIAPSASGYGIDFGGTAANALDVVGGIAGLFGGTPVEVIIGAALGSTASFIDIDGSVSFGGTGMVDLATSGAIADNAGTLTAATLEFDASSFLQSAAAAIDTALLQGDGGLIGGNVRLAGTANSIATLGPLSLASGTLALTDADTLVIGGAVTASNIYLTDSNEGGIFIGDTLLAGNGGTIGLTSDALTSAASTATISAPGGVVALAPYTATDAIDIGGTGFAGLQLNNGLINLIGANILRIGTAGGGTIYTEGSVSIAPSALVLTGGSMDFTGTLAGPGLMSLAAAGSIAESPAAALIFGTIDGSAGAGADLGGRNSFGTIGDFAAGGDIVLRDLVSLAIDGTVSTSGSLSLEGLAFQEFGTGQLDALELNSGATTIGGNVFLTGANTITDLGTFFVAQGGTLALLDDRSLTVLGDVQADFISLSAGTIDFGGFLTATTLLALASDFVTQTAGTISAFTLSSLGSIGGNMFLTGDNAVTILSGFSVGAGDTLALTDATALTLGGTDIAPFASLTADGITFAGTFDAADLLLLGGAGAVTQTAGTIIAGTLATDGNIGGAITLLGPNLFGTLGGIAADGNIALNDGQLEDIAGLVSTTGTITLEGTGNIDEIAGGTLAAATLNSGGTEIGGDVFLTNANSVTTVSDFSVAAGHTLAFADAGSLTLAGTIFAGFASLSGSFLDFAGSLDAVSLLDLASTGNVTQSSGTITTGTLVSANTIGGDVTLLDANTISTLGAFTLAALHTLSLRDAGLLTVGGPVFAPVATLAAASINLDGNIDGTALALEASGAVNQSGGTIGSKSLSSGGTTIGGNVTLGGANQIVTLANFDLASGSTLALNDARALTLGGSDFASFDSFSATSLDFEGFVTAATLLQLASTGAVKQGSGTIQAGTLVSLGSINGNVSLTAFNDIGTLGNFAVGAGDTLALTDAPALTLAGAIIAPFATFSAASVAISGSLDAAHLLALVSTGGIGETGSITAGTLTSLGSLDGTTNLTVSNTIGTLGIFAVGPGDSFALDDTGLLTVAGPVTGPVIDLFAGTIAIPGTIAAGTLLALDAATSIGETGSLFAPTLTSGGGTIGGGETLLGTNTIGTLGDIALGGHFAVTNTGTLIIAGTLHTPGDVTFEDNAGITETSGSLIAGTLDTGGTTLGGNLVLDGTNTISNLGNITLGSGLTFNLADTGLLTVAGTVFAPDATLSAASFAIAGALDGSLLALASPGTIHETTGTIAVTTLTAIGTIGGDAYLTNSNVIGTLTNVTMAAGTTLDLTDIGALVLAGSIIAPDATLSAPTLAFDGAFDAADVLALTSVTSVTEGADGAIIAGTLTSLGSVDGDVFLTGNANTIGTVANFTVGSGDTFALDDTGLLDIAGPLSGPNVTLFSPTITIAGLIDATLLALESTGRITESVGTIVAATLTSGGTAIGGNVNVTASNTIGTLGMFAVGSGASLALDDTGLLTVAGPVTGPIIDLFAGTIAIPGTITAGTLLALDATTSIGETGSLFTPTLTSGGGTIGGGETLLGTNTIGTLGDIALGGHFAVTNTGTLIIAGTLDTPGDVTFEDNAGITEAGGLIRSGTLDTGGTTLGGNLLLDGSNTIGNLGALTLGTGLTFNLKDAGLLNIAGTVFAPNATLSAGSFAIAGALDGTLLALASPGTIHETSGTIAVGTLTAIGTIGGDAYLTNSNVIGTLTNVTMAAGTTLDLTDIEALVLAGSIVAPDATLSAPTLAFDGAFDAANVLALTSVTSVTEGPDGAITAGTLTSLGSVDGDIFLTGNANTIATIANFTVGAGDTFALDDTGLLDIAGPLSGPNVTLFSPTITIAGLIDATLLALESTGRITESVGTIVAASLTSGGTTIGGNVNLTASNTIGTLGMFAVGGGASLALEDTGLLTVAGPVTGPIIDLLAGTIAIPGTIAAGTLLALDAATSIGETGSLFAPTLTSGGGTIGGGETLLGTNTIGTLGDIALDGHFALTNTGTLIIAGTLHTPDDVTFEDNAGITETSGSLIAGTLDTGGTTLGGNLVLDGTNTISNLGNITLGSGLTFNLADTGLLTVAGTVLAPNATLSAASFAIAGALDGTLLALASPGTIHETTGTIAVTTLTAIGTIGGDAYLTNSNVIGTLTNVTMAAGTTFDLTDIEALVLAGSIIAPDAILTAPSLTFDGAFDAGNVLALTSATSVTEGPDGAIIAGTLTSLGSVDGDIFLTGNANTIGTVANFTVGSGDTFALDDTGLLDIAGPLTGPNVTLFSPTITIAGLIDATLLALESTGSITETVGTIVATTLTSVGTVIGGDLALLGSNTIGTLGDLSLAGNFALNNTGTLNIDGTLATPGTVALTDDAGVFEALGQMDIGTLTTGAGSIGGAADFTGAANTIGNLGNFTLAAGQTLVLDDTGLLNVFGTVFAPIATFSTDTLAIGGALDGMSLALINDGTATETGGTISVATLTGAGDGLVSLLDANSITTLGAFAAGSLALKDGIDLAIGGLVSSASTITLEDPGNIAEIAGGTLAAPVLNSGGTTIGGSVTLLNVNSIGTIGQFAAAQNIAFDDGSLYALNGILSAGGTVSLAGAGLAEIAGGTIDAAELLSIGSLAGGVTLNNGNTLATLGGFTADDLFLDDATALTLDGLISLSSANGLGLAAAGGITQASGQIIAAQLTSDGRTEGGNVVLNEGNSISTLGAFSGIGNLDLKDLHALNIAGVVALGGTLGIQDTGNVIQTGGSITAAALTTDGGRIAGYALFNRQNSISSIQNFTALGGLSLTDAVGLILSGAIDTGTADLRLADSGNNISQSAHGVITAGLLTGSAGNIWLGSSLNAIADLRQVNTGSLVVYGVSDVSGPINASIASILSSGDMTVTGNVDVAGKLLLHSGGMLSQTAGTIAAGNEYLNGQFIYLGASNFAGTLTGNATQVIGQTAGLASASGVILLQSGTGRAFQNAGGTLTGYDIVLSSSSGSVQVAGSIVASHGVTLSGKYVDDEAANLSASGADFSGQYGVTLNGNNAISGLLSVSAANGKVAQYSGNLAAGTIVADAGSTGIALNGNVMAQSATLAVNTLAAPAFGGGVQLDGNISVAGGLYLSSGDGIYQTGGVVRAGSITGTATFGAADNINLSGGTMYDAGALNLFAGGTIKLDDSRLQASFATLESGVGVTLGGTNVITTGLFATAGTFVQTGGLIQAGTAAISASSYADINGALVIGGSLALTGGTMLADNSTGLYAGTAILTSPRGEVLLNGHNSVANPLIVTAGTEILQAAGQQGRIIAPAATLTAGGDIVLDGEGIFTGALDLLAGGDIFHDAGTQLLSAGTLEGRAAQLASFTAPTDFGTIGSFVMQDSVFSLVNSGTLAITGPLVANAISITAVGLVTLLGSPDGGLFISGVLEPKTAVTAKPGDSVITVTQGPNGAAPLITQTGTFYINSGPEAAFFPTFANMPATLFMNMLPDGNIDFQPSPPAGAGLYGPSIELSVALGNTGIVSGNVDLQTILVISGTASNLTGLLDGVGGSAGASKGNVVPFPRPPFQFNACPIGSVNCIILPIESLPTANPLQNFDVEERKRKSLNKNVTLPGVATRDF